MHLEEVTFVVTDVETTGFSPQIGSITEIAMVKVKRKEIIDEFTSLVNPQMPIPYEITQITGIDDNLVTDAPTAVEIAPQISLFLGDGIFTAHNVSFDLGFVNSTLGKGLIPPMNNQKVCTLKLAKKLLAHLKSKSLENVTRELQIAHRHKHRAAGDAYATAEVLIYFLDLLEKKFDVTTLEDLLTYQ